MWRSWQGSAPDAKMRMFFAKFDQKGWIDLLDRVVAEDPPPGEPERELGTRGGLREMVPGCR